MRVNPSVLRRERRMKLAAFLFVVIAAIAFLLAMRDIFISFLLAILIVYQLKPSMIRLERMGMSKSTAISLLFAAFTFAAVVAGFLLAPLVGTQFTEFHAEMPRYQDGLTAMILKIENQINGITGALYHVNILDAIWPLAQKYFLSYIDQVPGMATQIFTIIALAPFFAFFLLRDGREITRWLLSLVPNNLFEMALSLTNSINEQVGGFIRARILESAIVGAVVCVGLLIIGFPYAVILAVFAGITNLIPYVGPVIGAVPALVVAAVDKDGSMTVLFVTIIYFAAQLIDMLFIIPLVVARIVNLHPVLVVLAIIAGAQVMGILGMIISIPVFSALKLTFSAVYRQLLAQRSDY